VPTDAYRLRRHATTSTMNQGKALKLAGLINSTSRQPLHFAPRKSGKFKGSGDISMMPLVILTKTVLTTATCADVLPNVTPWRELVELYRLTQPARNLEPRYNVAPTTTIDVLRVA
jgi:hypothetical protein